MHLLATPSRALLLGSWVALLVACAEPAANVQNPPPVTLSAPGPGSASPTAPHWQAELDWARGRFPELATLRTEIDVQPLLSWVPAQERAAIFVSVVHHELPYRCAPATAQRAQSGDHIEIVIPGPEQVENGEKVRRYVGASASRSGFYLAGSSGKQRQRRDGRWENVESFGTTGVEFGWFLGPVTPDAVHFRYRRVELAATCGPVAPLPCDAGGTRHCNRCEEVTIELKSTGPLRPAHRARPPFLGECSQPCPEIENAELGRVKRLIEHHRTGFVLDPGPSTVGLYRSLASCEAASAAIAAPATK